MLKVIEPLINIVNDNRPKMLSGLTQNGKWPGVGVLCSPIAEHGATGGQAGAKRSVGTNAEHGKPVSLLERGRKVVRPTVVARVKEIGESEGPAVMAGIRAETSPGAKASRLPICVSSRDNLNNGLRRKRR
jgi:hypothetical protein